MIRGHYVPPSMGTMSTESVRAPRPERRATESYSVSTAKERNVAGVDAGSLECHCTHERGHYIPYSARSMSSSCMSLLSVTK